MPAAVRDKEDSESSDDEQDRDHPCIVWCGSHRKMPVLVFHAEAIVSKDGNIRSVGERYNLAFKIVRTESRLVRGLLTNHGFHEVHPNSNDFNLMWTGSHLKPYLLRNLQDFQKVNHFPRSYELTRKDRLFKNIQRMQQMHGFKNFHIVPQTFVLPSEFQEFCSYFSKDRGPWIIKPVASSRGRGIYLVSNPNQIPLDENILVSRYISNPLLIDDFKFDVRLYVLVTSYEPLIIYLYEEGLARFATVKYDRAAKNIKNQFMHLTNYSVNKKSRDYVSCDDPEVEDYGNKWSMSAILRYLKQEGKDTTLLMGQVEDLVIKAVLSAELQIATACKMFVPHRTNCFELYGFDVLIDSNLKPWLLEVNLSPSLACDAPLDLKIKASMISDMFSLVGFVCKNPLSRQARPGRTAHDLGSKCHPQKCQSQRPTSAHDSDANGLKERQRARKGECTLGLTTEELKVLGRIREEHERRGGFVRIFPTAQTWEQYKGYLEYKTSMNCMVATRLFPERSLLVQMGTGRHVIQYERKLLSLEARKRRQRHLAERATVGRRRRGGAGGLGARGIEDPTPEITDEEEEDDEEEEEEDEEVIGKPAVSLHETKLPDPPTGAPDKPKQAAPQTADPVRPATPPQSKPKINLLQILQQGWDLSKVQARMAFSSFLQRVQLRLLAESRGNGDSACPEKDDDQMELVIRFLKRAIGNLQQDLKMVLPSRRLPLPDRRRILSHQLGEFLRCYNKETEQMVKKMEALKDEEHCVDPDIFQEFVTDASESDLEEVLTFYTHKNKSASVFLGTASRKAKANDNSASSGEPAKSLSQRAVSAAKEEAGSLEHLGPTVPQCLGPVPQCSAPVPQLLGPVPQCSAPVPQLSGPVPQCSAPAPQLSGPVSQPSGPVSQPTPLHPPALDCAHIHLQHTSPPDQSKSLPKCQARPLVPAPLPPQASTPAPSMALTPDSSQTPRLVPPQPSASAATLPHATWATASRGSTLLAHTTEEQPSQRGRPIDQTRPLNTAAAQTLLPSTAQIYSQKLSRPISARQASRKPSPSRSRPSSAGIFKDPDPPSIQFGSDQQAIVAALKKLAEKQTSRQYSATSHISLLTQHLTNLNLANGAFSKSGFTLGPSVRHVTGTLGPVRAEYASPVRAPRDDGDAPSDGDAHGAYRLITGATPPQRYHPSSGSYQLQFAIQQLQQQRMQSCQLLDHSRARQQAIMASQASVPHTTTAPRPPHDPPVPPAPRPVRGGVSRPNRTRRTPEEVLFWPQNHPPATGTAWSEKQPRSAFTSSAPLRPTPVALDPTRSTSSTRPSVGKQVSPCIANSSRVTAPKTGERSTDAACLHESSAVPCHSTFILQDSELHAGNEDNHT
ncbi:hypothetical protein GJAV_G00013080 [Gymnothorax javanicus]|nr:hypothetical protein GJAV_G00013080 [Gymnothorax javanicus]